MSESVSASAEATNAKAYSVSELAFAMKRTLEESYSFVRLRGEVSKVTRHASGHVYLTLKDDKASIDGVVWKGSVRTLKCQPEQGLEVIVTGKITTYPARSSYQIVIESMEPAGVGALLAQLERLKARMREEGLFELSRKKPLPRHPAVIGVVTSPTGAVIRDILHRITDRWPVHVLVWPVIVQGDQAAAQVAAAVRGFNALPVGGSVPRPDLLIVARGGGSIEDLWPFNDEALARTVAASAIPLISAVGHETDTTLIDFVSDRRAPTPTGAAEIATPVIGELRAAVMDYARRLMRCIDHGVDVRRTRLEAASRGLPRPADLLALASQRFDLASGRLGAALERNASAHERDLMRAGARLTPALLARPQQVKAERLAELSARLELAARRAPAAAARRSRLPELEARLEGSVTRRLQRAAERLSAVDKLRVSLNPDRPLELGFARVRHADGRLVRRASELAPGEALALKFIDGEVGVRAEGEPPHAPAPSAALAPAAPPAPKPARRPATAPSEQGDLF
jgi:exodeoxyribonuclease VII large subunit